MDFTLRVSPRRKRQSVWTWEASDGMRALQLLTCPQASSEGHLTITTQSASFHTWSQGGSPKTGSQFCGKLLFGGSQMLSETTSQPKHPPAPGGAAATAGRGLPLRSWLEHKREGGEVPKRECPCGHLLGWAETHSARTTEGEAGSDVGNHVAPPPKPPSLEEEEQSWRSVQ
ncbi:PREDICTED: uncharacterized protein LOC102253994 [Myotis brandtii]|uniref:uncharacterized protein LOC102253994 n=1 Tax=Myotis brandtii TaxID=109478 RepID=UPI0007046706|nr:PREDICTED: uncharacterized protein LOC102253994 [Myotis brandtii]